MCVRLNGEHSNSSLFNCSGPCAVIVGGAGGLGCLSMGKEAPGCPGVLRQPQIFPAAQPLKLDTADYRPPGITMWGVWRLDCLAKRVALRFAQVHQVCIWMNRHWRTVCGEDPTDWETKTATPFELTHLCVFMWSHWPIQDEYVLIIHAIQQNGSFREKKKIKKDKTKRKIAWIL